MKIWLGQHRMPDFPQGSAVTIGNFDGVHLGHKHILQKLKQEADARGFPSSSLSSNHNPKNFLPDKPVKQPYRISPLRTKLNLLEQTGCVDAVWVLRFNQTFADMDAQDFINLLLRKTLNTRYLLIGDDFRFEQVAVAISNFGSTTGYSNRSHPICYRRRHPYQQYCCAQCAFRRSIRLCQKLLGHDYTLSGKVKHGKNSAAPLMLPPPTSNSLPTITP